MIMRICLWFVAMASIGLHVDTGIAADPVAWLPSGVNAIARINVSDIFDSPIAKNEGWFRKTAESFIQQESFIPPGTTQIIVGAELDLSDNFVARQKYSVLVPEKGLTFEKLSAWLPAGIETLSGKQATQFASDGYVVDAGDGCWLTAASGNRQLMSRWIRTGSTPGGSQLSPYLLSAVNSKHNPSQVLLAIDLQDSISAANAMEQIKSNDSFKSVSNAKNIADVIESILGFTMLISVASERTGTITVDFGKDASPLKGGLENLIDELLGRVGVPAEAVLGWKWNLKGNQIIGTGPLTPGSGREVLSILDPPSITHAISATASTPATDANPRDQIAKNSLRYCNSLKVLLDDLRKTLNKEKDNHAILQERYSRKIDGLPKLNVDAALLDFSERVSSSLRYQGQVHRMNRIRAGTHKRQTFAAASMPGNVGPFGNYGGGNAFAAGDSPGILDAQGNEAAKEVRFSEWKQIEDGLVAVRRAMTQKYQLEF
jgi:hypothetical protein